MRAQFPEFYPRTDHEVASIWREGLVVVDTNVLLGFYQYPAAAFEEFVAVLQQLGGRFWVPYQVGLEYQRNRLIAMPQPKRTLERLLKDISDIRARIEGVALPDFHPTLNVVDSELRRASVLEALAVLEEGIRDSNAQLPDVELSFNTSDPVRDAIGASLEGRIGPPPAPDRLAQLQKDADQRFSKKIPPGYRDSDKPGDRAYGDYIIWMEMLDEMARRADASGLLFVTNDRKEDWWIREKEVLAGARPELVRESLSRTGRLVILCTPSEFLTGAQKHLRSTVSEETVRVAELVAEQSRVEVALRSYRMRVPDTATRVAILRHVYSAFDRGEITCAGDLGKVIEGYGETADRNDISNPLFYALISDAYGPFSVEGADVRLRDRKLVLRDPSGGVSTFVQQAQVAWLAQAMFRLRRSGFSVSELVDAFFGADAGTESTQLVSAAEAAMQRDAFSRGH